MSQFLQISTKFDFEKGLTNIKNEIDNARNIEALCPPGNPCINWDRMTVWFGFRPRTDRFARGSLITDVTYLVIYTDIISIQSSNDMTVVPF